MTIPNTYRKSRENYLVNFDYTDVASGTGIIHFKGFNASGWKLGTGDFYSSSIIAYASAGTTDFTKVLDLDFDLSSFNSPRTIKGKGIVQFCFIVERKAGNGRSYGYVVAKLRKWDGTSETEIANVTSSTLSSLSSANPEREIACLSLTIPKTHFKKEDILRLTLEGWSKVISEGSAGWIGIGTDPKNRDSDDEGGTRPAITPSTDNPQTITKLDFFCPFEINL